MDAFQQITLTLADVSAFKRWVTHNAEFSDRISAAFAVRLYLLDQEHGEAREILSEIERLERGTVTSTKPATQFRHPPLSPFWHKHFSTSRHTLRNIGERWNISSGAGNRDLERLIDMEIAENDDLESLLRKLPHKVVFGGLEDRSSAGRLTGDWIIFAKHQGNNYYLTLATHEEGAIGNAEALFEKLRHEGVAEFPFLFV